MSSLLGQSFLNSTSNVRIVANDTLDDKPLVTALVDKMGNPKTDLGKNPLGSIRLEMDTNSLTSGFWNARKRVAFVTARLDLLTNLITSKKLVNGDLVPGRVKIIESPEPLYKGHQPKINPNQPDQVVGKWWDKAFFPIYMRMEYDETGKSEDKFMTSISDVKKHYEDGGAVWEDVLEMKFPELYGENVKLAEPEPAQMMSSKENEPGVPNP